MEGIQHFENGVQQLKSRYQNQSPEFWASISAAIRPQFTDKQRRPGVLLFILTTPENNLVTDTAQTISTCLCYSGPKRVYAKQFDLGISKVKTDINEYLENHGKVIVFDDIGELKHSDHLNLLHTLCDNDYAVHKDACFIFTVYYSKFNSGISERDNLQDYFGDKWNYIEVDRRSSLIARISGTTLLVKEDNALPNVPLIGPSGRSTFINNSPTHKQGKSTPTVEQKKQLIPNWFKNSKFFDSEKSKVLSDDSITFLKSYFPEPDSQRPTVETFLFLLNGIPKIPKEPTILIIISPCGSEGGKDFAKQLVNHANVIHNQGLTTATDPDISTLTKVWEESCNSKGLIINQKIDSPKCKPHLALLWYFCRGSPKFIKKYNTFWVFTLSADDKDINSNNYTELAKSKLNVIFGDLKLEEHLNDFIDYLVKHLVYVL